jgi:hypothetical protein
MGIFAKPFFMSENCKKGRKKKLTYLLRIFLKKNLSFHFHVQWDGNFGICYQVFHHPDFPFLPPFFSPQKYSHLWPKPRISPTYIPDG